MNRTDRLFALAEELRISGEQGRSSVELADLFEVSSRTIKRDMAALAEAGIPVWATEGRGGGYRLATKQRALPLPRIEFDEREATAVAVALAAQRESPFAIEAQSALRKIMRSMHSSAVADVERLASRIWTATPTPRRASARVIDEALRARRVVRIDYEDADGERSRRAIEPLAYAHQDGHWYVLAWCRLRMGGRSFRLDRIRRATATREVAPDRELDAEFGQAPEGARTLAIPR